MHFHIITNGQRRSGRLDWVNRGRVYACTNLRDTLYPTSKRMRSCMRCACIQKSTLVRSFRANERNRLRPHPLTRCLHGIDTYRHCAKSYVCRFRVCIELRVCCRCLRGHNTNGQCGRRFERRSLSDFKIFINCSKVSS